MSRPGWAGGRPTWSASSAGTPCSPRTAKWAALEVAREAARRTDAAARGRDANPARLRSLFSLGFAVDERLADRLVFHKRSEDPPEVVLPELGTLLARWDRDASS